MNVKSVFQEATTHSFTLQPSLRGSVSDETSEPCCTSTHFCDAAGPSSLVGVQPRNLLCLYLSGETRTRESHQLCTANLGSGSVLNKSLYLTFRLDFHSLAPAFG